MNILVINPPNKPFTNIGLLAEPIDVLQIASIIKEQYQNVSVIDMDVLKMDNDINEYLKKDTQNIIVFVYDYQIPLHTSKAIGNIFEIIKNIKAENFKAIIIGKTSSHYYNEFLNNGIDIVISNQAEEIINSVIGCINDLTSLKQIKGLYIKDNSTLLYTGDIERKDYYSNLPIPDRSLVNISKYINTRTMITSRGCNGCCSYCTTPFFFGRWYSKPYDKVVDEIEYLIKDYDANQILMLDDNFTIDKNRAINICREIKKRKIKIKLGCLASIKSYDKEMFKIMYDSGFRWVHFGIESGSEMILKQMNKPMDLYYIKQVIREVKEMGYRIRTSYILDYPNTTVDDLNKTIDLILDLKADEIRLHYLAYRVGTPIFKNTSSIEEQYIHKNKSEAISKELSDRVDYLLEALKKLGYKIIDKEINWDDYKDLKNIKMASLVPMRYGVDWND
ncbi:MAG: radical SAM protein [Bacilli bacterium]|nr:radical SAM protein [Bacilli bacterium]